MARINRTCRVCGKTYEACRTPRVDGVYHWQEVACSPEHGAIYLEKILKSRGLMPKKEVAPEAPAPVIEEPDEVEMEELFADDEEDGFEDEEFDEDEIEE